MTGNLRGMRPWPRPPQGALAALVLAGWLAVPTPAPAADQGPASLAAAIGGAGEELRRLDAELAALRRDELRLAQAATPGGDVGANPAAARLAVRVNQLELDLRTVTGRIEELSFQVKRMEERLEKFIADVDYRLADRGGPAAGGEARPPETAPVIPPPHAGGPRVLGPVAPPPAPASPPAAPASPPPPQTAAVAPPAAVGASARDDYARAFSLLQKGNYIEAEAAFSAFLQQHKDDPLADNARYWLAETYYARQDYRRAAEAFLDAYEKSKTGPKAPDTLLKLALSLNALGKPKEACASLRELGRAFPDAAPALKDRARQEQQKLNCS